MSKLTQALQKSNKTNNMTKTIHHKNTHKPMAISGKLLTHLNMPEKRVKLTSFTSRHPMLNSIS